METGGEVGAHGGICCTVGLSVGGNVGLSVVSGVAVVGTGIWEGDNDMEGCDEGDWGMEKKCNVIGGAVVWDITAFMGAVVCGVIGVIGAGVEPR